MGWGLGFSDKWNRWIGYSVPALCDFPHCTDQIDRGLDYICSGSEPYGGDGCGLFFCPKHHQYCTAERSGLCYRCSRNKPPFKPKPELMSWVEHLMTDSTWKQWRDEKGDGYQMIAKAWSEAKP